MLTNENTFAAGFIHGFAAGIETAEALAKSPELPAAPGTSTAPGLPPGTRLFRDTERRAPRLVLPATPYPDASPEDVLETFKLACFSGEFVEAGRWTLPASLTLEGESLAPVRPWELRLLGPAELVLCHIDGCWRVAQREIARSAALS
ncbi:MAG: hypothetical protein FD180_697 [Planctomycetota bacterium]|nr:MAG: hypothetical protein FD180_697 [Planctomycetota bacterium]